VISLVVLIPTVGLLYFFLFSGQIGSSRANLIFVDAGTLFNMFKNLTKEFDINLSLGYKLATGSPGIDYNVYIDKEDIIVMGEGFYKTVELLDKQKLSILTHEVGHNKNNHNKKLWDIRKSIVVASFILILYSVWNNLATSFVIFGLLLLFRPVIQILLNIYSFKQEYDADRFSVSMAKCEPDDLILAIKFLTEKSNLTHKPMWWHKLFIVDHPSVQDRIEHIQNLITVRR